MMSSARRQPEMRRELVDETRSPGISVGSIDAEGM
jgi:hypothetical protein